MSQSVILPGSPVNWGDALVVAAFRRPGGVNVAVNRIREQLGPTIGVRNTFGKLLHVERVEDIGPRDRFRAWLLLVALGQEPSQWGVSDDAVPPAYVVSQLRESLGFDVRLCSESFIRQAWELAA